jgi:hypothetical protein
LVFRGSTKKAAKPVVRDGIFGPVVKETLRKSRYSSRGRSRSRRSCYCLSRFLLLLFFTRG